MATKTRAKPKFKDYVSAMQGLKKSGQIPNLAIVYGGSEFLVNDTCLILKSIWKNAGNEPAASIEAKSLNPNSFSEILQQSSLFEPKNFAIIRRAQENRSIHKLIKDIPNSDAILNPMVFVFDTEKPNAYALKELRRLGASEFPCTDPWPNELPALIAKLAKRKAITLDQSALDLLLESVGSDLIKIENELNKFSMIFDKQHNQISADDIAPYLGMLRADHAFELDKLLISGHWSKAHTLLMDLVDRGESPIKVLGLLARHCRHAIHVLGAQSSGMSPRDLGFKLRLPVTVVTSYGSYVKGKTPKHFAKGLEICREIDQLCKSKRIAEDLMLSRIIDHLAL